MKKLITFTMSAFLVLTSCSKDDNNTNEGFDGSDKAIENFFSAEVLQAMNDLGFPVNQGAQPPIINGDYYFSPVELVASNMVNDQIGKIYTSSTLKFSNQNNKDLSLAFQELSDSGASSIGVQSYISGSDDKFSVFIKVEYLNEGHVSILAYAYSGTLLEDKVENLQFTLIMLDDKGDPNNNLIENGQGRLFKDSDGISPKQ